MAKRAAAQEARRQERLADARRAEAQAAMAYVFAPEGEELLRLWTWQATQEYLRAVEARWT